MREKEAQLTRSDVVDFSAHLRGSEVEERVSEVISDVDHEGESRAVCRSRRCPHQRRQQELDLQCAQMSSRAARRRGSD